MKQPQDEQESAEPLAHPTPWPSPGAYAWCESVTASSYSPWHIRQLDAAGLKLGGGITTPSLCGFVRPTSSPRGMGGWDLSFPIDAVIEESMVCKNCWKEYTSGSRSKEAADK